MDDVFLLVLPTLVVFGIGITFVLRHVVNAGGERYQYREYRLDEPIDKQDGKRGDGGGARDPTSRN
ncbi:MAG TPA: hypothetical protein VKK19_05695 [Candidatus Dormibacteraeota bacterium]|nr:hypothetical protein [Candidatus Dormibacteraeota bacterium]